jgi:predicted O-linked N-acetylglucosamine transferase (SPINDLY family)
VTEQIFASIATIARHANAGAWREALAHARALDHEQEAATHADAKLVCAQVYLATGFVDEARRTAAEAVALANDLPGPYLVRARAAASVGDGDAAIADLETCLKLAPESLEARLVHVDLLHRLGRFDAVSASLDAADRAGVSSSELAQRRSVNALVFGEITLAERMARRALEGTADPARAHQWLGTVLLQEGRLDEARASFAAAKARAPDLEQIWTDDLFAANYDPTLSAEVLKQLYVDWAAKFAPSAPRAAVAAPAVGKRRLRVGYVSQDLRGHSIRHFIRPLVSNHDRKRVESFAYSATTEPDAETAKLHANFENWRDVSAADDTQLADAIRADGIDVLVDLGGHTAGTRLKVFARRPAPVQVTWLGYGGTTGVAAIDWYLGDARMLPPGAEAGLVEGAWRLPRACFAYDPPAEMPEPGPLPVRKAGRITFASFSRLARINDRLVATWAKILAQVPASRLFLNALPFVDQGARARMAARFGAHGISADRLDLRYTRPQPSTWAAYREVDIALDPYVHNGGVTSFEALWMGAPLVSKRDRAPLGRYGDCLLGALGMDDWCTDTDEAYVARAVRAAKDLDALEEARAGMRARMKASELCDGPGLARAVEAAFLEMRARA